MARKDTSPLSFSPVVIADAVDFDGAACSAKFVISTESRDREGDVVISQGCVETLPSYAANPVVLFDHGMKDMMPIGTSEYPDTKQCTVEVLDDKIIARAFFHTETLLACQTARLVEKGVLRAASIGYDGISGQPVDPRNPKRGMIYDKWELVEWSVVPVPCNPDALRQALGARWEGKHLVEPIARRFKSLLKPSKTLILPASLPSPKRKKAMPDETVATDQATLPAGAQGVKVLMDSVTSALSAVQEVYPTIEQPQVIKMLDKFIEKLKGSLSELLKGAASIYPDIEEFKQAADADAETEAEPDGDEVAGEETTESDADTDADEKSDDVSDVGDTKSDDEEDDKEEKRNKSLKLRQTKSWQKDCEPHVSSLKDAAELLEDMSKSANIPSGYKRQCKGVLPGVTSACSWMSGKANDETPEETPETKSEDSADDEEMTDETKAAVLKSIQIIGSKMAVNAAEIKKLRKVDPRGV